MHSRSRSSNKAAPALIWLLAWMATVLFGWAPNALSCLWSFSMLALDRVEGGVIIEHTHTHRSLRWQFSFDSWDLYPSPLMHSINCRKEKGHSSTYLTHCGQTSPGLPCCYASLWCDSVSNFPEDCRYCGANVRLERSGHQHEQSLDATVEGTKSPCYWHVGEEWRKST